MSCLPRPHAVPGSNRRANARVGYLLDYQAACELLSAGSRLSDRPRDGGNRALRYRARVSRIIGGPGKGRRLQHGAAGEATRPDGRARAADALRHPGAAHPGLPLPRRVRGQRRRRARGALARRGAGRARRHERRGGRGGRARTRAPLAQRGRRGAGLPAGRAHRAAGARRRRAPASTSSTWTRPTRASSTSRCSSSWARGSLAEGGVVVAEHFHKRALPETIGAPRAHAASARRRPPPELLRAARAATTVRSGVKGESAAAVAGRLPGLVRPDHQRPPRHHRPRPRGLRRGAASPSCSTRRSSRCSRSRSGWRSSARPTSGERARRGRHLLGPARGLRGAGGGHA